MRSCADESCGLKSTLCQSFAQNQVNTHLLDRRRSWHVMAFRKTDGVKSVRLSAIYLVSCVSEINKRRYDPHKSRSNQATVLLAGDINSV